MIHGLQIAQFPMTVSELRCCFLPIASFLKCNFWQRHFRLPAVSEARSVFDSYDTQAPTRFREPIIARASS